MAARCPLWLVFPYRTTCSDVPLRAKQSHGDYDSGPLRLLFHFVVHTIFATFLFAFVAGTALVLWAATHWIETRGAPYEIVIVCHYVSLALFGLDVVLFVFYVLCQSVTLVKEIWDDT